MRNGVLFAVVAVLIVIGGITASLGRGDPPEPPFRGLVLDAEGIPVEGAAVQLRAPNGGCFWGASHYRSARTATDAAGRFDLPEPPGAMEFYVTHPDYAPAWVTAKDEAVVRLRAPCFIKLDLPAEAMVTITQGHWPFVREKGRGTVICGPLPPDTPLSVRVDALGHRPFYETFDLREGETGTISVALEKGLSLAGQVSPRMAGVRIMAHQADATETEATTDADGAFELTGLREGSVRIVAIAPDRPVAVVDAEAGGTVEVRWK